MLYILFCSYRGSSHNHHLGHGSDEHQRTPKLVAGLSEEKVIEMAVGAHHVITLSEGGNVHGWGKNSGEEVDKTAENVSLPKLLPLVSNCGAVHVFCGANEVRILEGCALKWSELLYFFYFC